MKLLIVRHALAMDKQEFAESGQPDDQRPLIEKGRKQMKKTAKSLIRDVGAIDVLATSPLLRATETADILSNYWKPARQAVIDELKPGAAYDIFLDWLKALGGSAKRIAVVGHEPHLAGLTSWLLSGTDTTFIKYKKSGMALLEFDEVAPGNAQLLWMLTPKLGIG